MANRLLSEGDTRSHYDRLKLSESCIKVSIDYNELKFGRVLNFRTGPLETAGYRLF